MDNKRQSKRWARALYAKNCEKQANLDDLSGIRSLEREIHAKFNNT